MKAPFPKTDIASPHSVNSVHSVKKPKAAFSLIELLVAMAVLSLLVVLLMGMVDSATTLWRENENRVDAYREARAALNIIASDLRALHPTGNPAHFAANLPGLPEDNVVFLAALPASAQEAGNKSDLCVVGFYVEDGPKTPVFPTGEQTRNLYRVGLDSNPTFQLLTTGGGTGVFDIGELLAAEEILASNIASIRITPYQITETGALASFTQSPTNSVPHLIEVELVAVSSEFATRFPNPAQWTTDNPAFQANSRTFTTRVPIRQPVQ